MRHLTRAHRTAADASFTAWLETIGNGICDASHCVDGVSGYVAMDNIGCVDSAAAAVEWAFPRLGDSLSCSEAKILSATNDRVDFFNNLALNALVTQHGCAESISYSADKAATQ